MRFDDAGLLAKTVAEIVETKQYDGLQVDGLDGVAFEPGEYYLTLARWLTDDGRGRPPRRDYHSGQQVFYRSIQQRETDLLTMHDYLWRWDTDWFWCSAPFGVQNPTIRRFWPSRYRRSDVYHRLLGLNDRTGFIDRVDRRKGRPQREKVIQDVELPVERLPEFLDWFDAEVGMRPVWLCPLVSQGTSTGSQWPTYPLHPGHDLRQRRLLGHRPRRPRRSRRPAQPRDRGQGRRSSAGINRSTPRLSTTGRPSTGSTTGRTSPR